MEQTKNKKFFTIRNYSIVSVFVDCDNTIYNLILIKINNFTSDVVALHPLLLLMLFFCCDVYTRSLW